jgi:hypothetical protein
VDIGSSAAGRARFATIHDQTGFQGKPVAALVVSTLRCLQSSLRIESLGP